MQTKIYLGDWFFNSGIVGFLRILEHNNDSFAQIEDNYITFDTQSLRNFHKYYFNYFFDKYNVANRVKDRINQSFEKIASTLKTETTDKVEIKRQQEKVKSEKKYIKSVIKTQLDKIKKIDENVYQTILEKYNEIDAVKEKEDIEKLTKIGQIIISEIEKDDINKRLTMNLFKSILSNNYFGQPSFLNVVNTKLSYEEQENLMYKDYISNIIETDFLNKIFVFKYKGYERILATLSYSKLIIDEIQAYSPNIVAIIIKGLEMINRVGGKFMVMTATLPRIYKEELEKRKIYFEFGKYIKPIERHKIKLQEKEIVEDLDNIIEKGKNSKVLVIVNTVDKAIELYLKLKEKQADCISLLHARFIYKDRNKKEENIKKFSKNKQEKGIWITTQIVEASLDIDFDYLFTEMSTLDSLFQRLGRCFRSREYNKEEPNVWIYTKNASGIKYVYDEEIHRKSIELIQEYDGQVLSEETKIDLVDKLYSKELLEGTKFLKEFDDSMKILDNIIDYKVDKKTAQKLLRNIDNFVVIPKTVYEKNLALFEQYENCGKDYKQKNKIKREIDKLTVAITQGGRRKTQDRISRNPYCEDIWIIDVKYNDEIGLKLEKDEEYDENEQFL